MEFATYIDGPIAVIGDVHGHTDKLASIVGALQRRDDIRIGGLCLLGTLSIAVPTLAGPSKMVGDLATSHPKLTAVAGNHDFAMSCALGLIDGHPVWRDKWVDRYDSEPTFSSYGCEHGDLASLRSKIPGNHAKFLAQLPWVVEHPDFVFVHAGLDMNEPYAKQIESAPSTTRQVT